MVFAASNPFPKPLKFDLFMLLLDGPEQRPRSTSSCPVQLGLEHYELWPHPIFTLLAMNFRFVEGSAARSCDAPPEMRER